MSRYPLLFTFRDIVVGRSFVAGVEVDGRALLVEEREGDFWMYGIEPGAIAAHGGTFEEAHQSFREAHRLALYDIAHEVPSFAEFEAEVRLYHDSLPERTLADWEAAVEEVRKGAITLSGLPKQDASSQRRLAVRQVELEPDTNESIMAPALVGGSPAEDSQLAA